MSAYIRTFAWQLVVFYLLIHRTVSGCFMYFGIKNSIIPLPWHTNPRIPMGMWHLQTHSFQSVIAKHKTTSSIRLTRLLIGARFGRWSTRNTRSDKMPSVPRLMTWYSLLFKMLLLETWYNFSDCALEERINDSITFSQFLGLKMEEVRADA